MISIIVAICMIGLVIYVAVAFAVSYYVKSESKSELLHEEPNEEKPKRYTQDPMSELGEDDVFVFGSNTAGQHGGGAAKFAHAKFGAEWGIGEGMTGDCYAYPTLNGELIQRSETELLNSVFKFYKVVRENPEKTFYLTKVGCGIGGYSEEYMKNMFTVSYPNLIVPEGWDK